MQKESQAEPVLFLLHYEFKIAGLIHLLKVVWWCTFTQLLNFYEKKNCARLHLFYIVATDKVKNLWSAKIDAQADFTLRYP